MEVARPLRTRSLGAIALVAGVLGGTALGAQSAPSRVQQQILAGGSLTFLWHGDPSRGCALAGVCAVHGSLVVRLDGYGALVSFGRSGSAQLTGASATARVRRDDPLVPPGECVDVISTDPFGIRIDHGAGGGYSAALDSSPVSSGRCAGPLAGELGRLRLPVSRLRTKALGFDLRGQIPLSAGPFSGTLLSTLVLRPATAAGLSFGGTSSSSSSSSTSPPPPHRTVLVEYARVRYRIRGVSGTLLTAFTGAPEPVCEVLDDCGVTGSLSLSIPRYSDSFTVSGASVVRRRVGAARALADLRAGRLGLDLGPVLLSSPRAVISEALARAGAGGCTDTRASLLLLQIGGFGPPAPSGALPVALGADSSTDPLRTHCPGPSTADVTGVPNLSFIGPIGARLGRGSLATGQLGSPGLTLPVAAPGTFSSQGYSGTRTGSVSFSLSLLDARGGTRRERRG